MPRGKYVNHKGRSRHFTSPEELQQEKEELSEEQTSSEDEVEDGAAGTSKPKKRSPLQQKLGVGSDEDSNDESTDDDIRDKRKGVASLIEIENPNRAVKKATQKVKDLAIGEEEPEAELSRREREQIEKQKARLRYKKLHAAGKTREAKADLARLALVRQQRAEAAAKREAEKKALEVKKTGGNKA